MPTLDLAQRADLVAPQVLGAELCRGDVRLRITEVEAYLGLDDPASHAFRGPRGRAATMFGPPGHLYVYLSYGVHLAANIVCSPAGEASALLLRAGQVLDGEGLARERRGRPGLPAARLASGPGNLGRVLGLSLADDGAALGDEFVLTPARGPVEVVCGPRVGISQAADWPLRFWIPGDETVSAYRRSARAPRGDS